MTAWSCTLKAVRPARDASESGWQAGSDERFAEGVAHIELGDAPGGSNLKGPLMDQSHLRGILDHLWQLGIEVIKFETYLPDSEDPENTCRPGGREVRLMTANTYKRQTTSMDRLFTRSPFSLVTMVAHINGKVTEELLTVAVRPTSLDQRVYAAH